MIKKIGIGLLGLVVLLIGAVVVVPLVIDWNGYKPEIARAVKEATGRDLVIAGDIAVSILPSVSVRLGDVSLSNAPGAAEPSMFTLESADVEIALLPLIGREVIVEKLLIRAPVLHLAVDEKGRPNWAFEGAKPASTQARAEPPAEADRGLPISGLELADVRLEGGSITYRDARTGQNIVAKAIDLKATLAELSAPFTLEGRMTLNEDPVTLGVSLDSPASLLGGGRAALATTLDASRLSLSYKGGVRQQPEPAVDGTFDLQITSVGQLAAWLQRPLAPGQPDPGPLKVHAVLEGEGARMTLKQATIEGEALRAKATGGFDGTGRINRVTFNLETGVLDIDRYLPPPVSTPAAAAEAAKKPEATGKTAASAKRDLFAAIPDDPFDLAPFKETEAEIRIAIGGIKAMGYRVGKVGFDGSLRNGVLAANLTELRLYGGNVTGSLRFDGSGDRLGADTDLAIEKVDVGALARAVQGESAMVAGIGSGRIQAKGEGKSPRALARSLVAKATLSLGGIDVKDAPGALSKLDLAVDLPGVDASPTVRGSLVYNKQPVDFSLVVDPLPKVLSGGRFAVKLGLDSKRLKLNYVGAVQPEPVPGLDGRFTLDVPSVGKLAAWLDKPLPKGQPDPGPLRVHAVLEGEGARMTLKQATIEGEALRAKATGGFDGTGRINRVTFNLETGVLDIDRYLPPPVSTPAAAAEAAKKPEATGKTAASAKRDLFAAIPDDPFDLAPFKETEAEIRIAIGGIKAMGYRVGKVGFDGSLRSGVLAANLTELRLYGGNVTGSLRFDGSGDRLGADTNLAIEKVDIGALARAVQGESAMVAGIGSGRVQAKGEGKSPRALARSLVAKATLSLGGVDVKDAPGALSKLDLAIDLPGVETNTTVKGSLVYNKQPVDFSLVVDPLPKVLSGGRFATRLDLVSKPLKLSYVGDVQPEPVPGLDGRFNLDVPSVGRLLAWLDKPLPKGQPDPGPLKVDAVLSADGPRAALKSATIRGKALNAKASGSFDGSGAVAKIALDIEAGMLDIDRYLPPPSKPAKPAGARAAKQPAGPAPAAPMGDPLAALSDKPFDLTLLKRNEATLSLRLGGLKAMGYRLGKTSLAVNLKGGKLGVTLEEARLYGGNITGAVGLDGAGAGLGADVALTIDKVDVGALARAAQGKAAKVAGIASGKLRARARGKSPRALAESLSAKVDLALAGIAIKDSGMGTISQAALALDMPGLDRPTALKGNVVYNKEKVSFDLGLAPLKQVLSGKAFDLRAAVASKLLNARYDGKVQIQPAPGGDGGFDLDVPSVGKLAAWLGRPLDPARPDPGPLRVRASMTADGARVALREATIDGKALKVKASARIDSSTAITKFDADVAIIEADLNAYLPPQKGGTTRRTGARKPAAAAATAGRAQPSGWSEEPIDVSPLRQAEGRVKISIGRVRYGEVDIANGDATVTIANGVLKAVVAKLQLAGGNVALNATVDGSRKVPAVDYRLDVTGVRARPVLRTFAGSDRLSGLADFQASGRARGGNQKQMVETLNGEGRFQFRNGAIHGFNIASALRQAQTFGFGGTAGQKTDFAELSGSFTITNGVLRNRDLKMLAPLVRVTGGGVVPMPPRTVNYRTEAKLVGSLKGQGGQAALAGLPIPITIKGTWDNPSVGVDWKSVFTKAALDPSRLANMPKNMLDFGKNLGVALPIPGLTTGTGATSGGTGSVLGDMLKLIPGLPGAQPQQQQQSEPPPQPEPQQQPSPQEQLLNPLKTLKGLFGR